MRISKYIVITLIASNQVFAAQQLGNYNDIDGNIDSIGSIINDDIQVPNTPIIHTLIIKKSITINYTT